jgi:hypothetical protein
MGKAVALATVVGTLAVPNAALDSFEQRVACAGGKVEDAQVWREFEVLEEQRAEPRRPKRLLIVRGRC